MTNQQFIEIIHNIYKDNGRDVRLAVMRAFKEMEVPVELIDEMRHDEDWYVRSLSVKLCRNTIVPDINAWVKEYLNDPCVVIRCDALDLVKYKNLQYSVWADLALFDKDWRVRKMATELLSIIGVPNSFLYGLISKYRNDEDLNNRISAIQLMKHGKVPFKWVAEAILDDDPSVSLLGCSLLYEGAYANSYLLDALTNTDDSRLYFTAAK